MKSILLFACPGLAVLAQTPGKCVDLAKFQMPGSRIEINRAEMVTAGSAPGRPGQPAWVEKGQAPSSVTATGRAFPGRSRPLCAYPAHAQYTGQGNMEDAANFECRE